MRSVKRLCQSLHFVFLIVVLALIGTSIFSNWQMYDLYGATMGRATARTRLYKLEQVMDDLKSIESDQRGYLLTRQNYFRERFQNSLKTLNDQLNELDELFKETEKLKPLRASTLQAVTEMQDSLNSPPPLRQQTGPYVFEILTRSLSATELSRSIVDSLKADELKLLDLRNSQAQDLLRSNSLVLFWGGLLALVLVLITIWQISRNQRQKQKSETDLLESNRLLELQKKDLSAMVEAQQKAVMAQAAEFEDKKKIIAALQHTENELLAARDAAEAGTQAKSRFLAHMSHEIRTPLNGILGAAELLAGMTTSEEQREYLQIVEMSGESLLTIINDILDFSKVEAGKLNLEKVPFNLLTLLEDLKKIMIHSQIDRVVDLEFEIDPKTPTEVCGDPGRLMQVLINLVGNAIKFTPHGKVILALRGDEDETGTRLSFEVRDQGIGIAPDNFEKLFQAFNQADVSTSKQYGGTGLGLSISRHLVQLMGGTIGVRSRLGEGSTFWFTIHVGNIKTAAVVENYPPRKNPFLDSLIEKESKILVVEDNATNRKICLRTLLKLGFRAYAVDTGTAAIAELEAHEYDLVLMDVQMPGLDGYATTKLIREHQDPRVVKIPIVAMTANAVVGARERCLDSGMDDYLSKPVKASDLRAMVLKWLPANPKVSSEENLGEVDFSQLRSILGLQPNESIEPVVDIVQAYLASMPSFIRKITDSFAAQDWISLRDCAHGVKSSSGNIGAMGLSRLSLQIETLASRHPRSLTAEQVQKLSQVFAVVKENLENFLKKPDFETSRLISPSEISRMKSFSN